MRGLPPVSHIGKSESIQPILPGGLHRRNPVRCHPADAVEGGIVNPIPRNRNRTKVGAIHNPHIARRRQPALRPRRRRQTDGNHNQQHCGQRQSNNHRFHHLTDTSR